MTPYPDLAQPAPVNGICGQPNCTIWSTHSHGQASDAVKLSQDAVQLNRQIRKFRDEHGDDELFKAIGDIGVVVDLTAYTEGGGCIFNTFAGYFRIIKLLMRHAVGCEGPYDVLRRKGLA